MDQTNWLFWVKKIENCDAKTVYSLHSNFNYIFICSIAVDEMKNLKRSFEEVSEKTPFTPIDLTRFMCSSSQKGWTSFWGKKIRIKKFHIFIQAGKIFVILNKFIRQATLPVQKPLITVLILLKYSNWADFISYLYLSINKLPLRNVVICTLSNKCVPLPAMFLPRLRN